MIMKIQKKEKQVCDPLSFSRLSWQGLGTLSGCEWLQLVCGGKGTGGGLRFQMGLQLRSNLDVLSCSLERVSLRWDLSQWWECSRFGSVA